MNTLPDPIHHAMRGSTRAVLERLAADDRWDQQPVLLAVAHGDLLFGPETVDEALSDDLRAALNVERGRYGAAMALKITALPTPPFLWSLAGEVTAALRALTSVLATMRDDVPRLLDLEDDAARVTGLILVTEAWSINATTATAPIEGDFADHPDRVETRLAIGVDVAGEVYSASQRRGEATVHEDAVGGGRVEGAIPEALAGLLDVIADDLNTELAEEGS